MSAATWGVLETIPDCDEATKKIGLEILDVNNALLRIERGGTRRLTAEEQEWVAERRARLDWLRNARREIAVIRRRLNDRQDELFEASFKLAAREMLDRPTYDRIIERAKEIEATNNERRDAAATVGAAIGARANVGGMRMRRQS